MTPYFTKECLDKIMNRYSLYTELYSQLDLTDTKSQKYCKSIATEVEGYVIKALVCAIEFGSFPERDDMYKLLDHLEFLNQMVTNNENRTCIYNVLSHPDVEQAASQRNKTDLRAAVKLEIQIRKDNANKKYQSHAEIVDTSINKVRILPRPFSKLKKYSRTQQHTLKKRKDYKKVTRTKPNVTPMFDIMVDNTQKVKVTDLPKPPTQWKHKADNEGKLAKITFSSNNYC